MVEQFYDNYLKDFNSVFDGNMLYYLFKSNGFLLICFLFLYILF